MMTAMDTNVLGTMYLDGMRGLELSLPNVFNFALNEKMRIQFFYVQCIDYSMPYLKVISKFFLKHNESFRGHLGDYEKT